MYATFRFSYKYVDAENNCYYSRYIDWHVAAN